MSEVRTSTDSNDDEQTRTQANHCGINRFLRLEHRLGRSTCERFAASFFLARLYYYYYEYIDGVGGYRKASHTASHTDMKFILFVSRTDCVEVCSDIDGEGAIERVGAAAAAFPKMID